MAADDAPDPRWSTVIGTDAHLPAVPAASLGAPALRQRFAAPPAWQPEIAPDRRVHPRPSVPAAVLIGIVQRQVPSVLLTRRSDRLRNHAGQVCFPGGRIDAHDAGAAAAALREAEEEIGLSPSMVEPLGVLPAYVTHSGYAVSSLVALVAPDAAYAAQPDEVADVFEVPLWYLMSPANHRRHAVMLAGQRREFHSMAWPPEVMPLARPGASASDSDGSGAEDGSGASDRAVVGRVNPDRTVWGATAAMVRNLYWFLSA